MKKAGSAMALPFYYPTFDFCYIWQVFEALNFYRYHNVWKIVCGPNTGKVSAIYFLLKYSDITYVGFCIRYYKIFSIQVVDSDNTPPERCKIFCVVNKPFF